jgi:nucleotide sugar dehydrogenase
VSSIDAAEMTKLHENVFRAVNIALANELADTARVLGLDAAEIVDAAATKPYGFMRFDPGPGVGGHCIPCDPHYLLWQLRGDGHSPGLVDLAMHAIAARPTHVVDRTAEILSDDGRGLAGARVLVVGAAYKPGVEDTRESPALAVLDGLRRRGAEIAYHDPRIPELELNDGTRLESAEPSGEHHDAVIVMNLHPDQDRGWLADTERLLDATYRLQDVAHAVAL